MFTKLKSSIRVLIADDSISVCKALTDMLNSDMQICVAGVVHNGRDAVEIALALKPDIILMDIHMPVMDGFEATRQIMASNPIPILIVSESVFNGGTEKAFKAILCGALDIIDKRVIGTNKDKKTIEEFIEKIKFLSTVKVFRHSMFNSEKFQQSYTYNDTKTNNINRIIAVVSSTGGPEALRTILKQFPKDLPCGIVIVQHITRGFIEGLAKLLNDECLISVKVAENGEEIKPGIVYFAPSDLQMTLDGRGLVQLTDNSNEHSEHSPSGDVLLKSVANAYGNKAIGVILTGMGRDGVEGIKAIREFGGVTIAQDEKSCVVFGMPKAAIEANVIDKILPINEIYKEILELLKR